MSIKDLLFDMKGMCNGGCDNLTQAYGQQIANYYTQIGVLNCKV